METLSIKNDDALPEILHKNFTSHDDMENFKGGNILIRKIEYHQKWEKENQRLDKTENQAKHSYKSGDLSINGRLTCAFPVYILSMSGPYSNRSECGKKFGLHEVKVINTELFNFELRKEWNNNLRYSSFNVFQVEYTKGEIRKVPPYMQEPHSLSLYQKYKSFQNEEEYRFIFICRTNPNIDYPETLELKLDINVLNRLFE